MSHLVRPYRPDDLEPLVRLFTGAVHVLAQPFYDEVQRAAWAPEEPDREQWRARLSGIGVLVADEGGVLSGFIAYEPNGHIAQLYTAPHTARRGVASTLYTHVERDWIAAGVRRAFAEVSLAARAFFDRHGFEVVEEECVERRGVSFRRYAMAKAIGDGVSGI